MTKLTVGSPREAGMDADQIALIRERLPQWMDGESERGGVFLVARRGKIVLHEALGPQTDKADSPPMTEDSIFQVSSISKPITATGIMLLVEDGLLGLNRPIKEYFPEVCGEGTDDIEVQHLLTHTSGFREMDVWTHYFNHLGQRESKPQTNVHPYTADYLEITKDAKSDYAPGTLMEYCSHNFALLAALIGRVTGQPLLEFFKERIFDPLGMEGACYARDPSKQTRHVIRGKNVPAGSIDNNDIIGIEGTEKETFPYGFMGANARAIDLAILGQALLNKGTYRDFRLLSPASVHEMTRDQLPGVPAQINEMQSAEASWGLGWAIQGNQRWPWYSSTLVPKGAFWHTGNGGSQMWVDPVNEIVGVYLSVTLILDDDSSAIRWHGDIFQNMVTAAAI